MRYQQKTYFYNNANTIEIHYTTRCMEHSGVNFKLLWFFIGVRTGKYFAKS